METIEGGASEGGAAPIKGAKRSAARPALRNPLIREMELSRLALFWPHEIRDDIPSRQGVIRRLKSACHRMRQLGLIKTEQQELAFLRRSALAASAA